MEIIKISSVDFIKEDSKIKILYACTPKEIEIIYKYHNCSDGMKGNRNNPFWFLFL